MMRATDTNRGNGDTLDDTGDLDANRDKEDSITRQDVDYDPDLGRETDSQAWRVRITILSSNPAISFELDVIDDVILGRGGNSPALIDLAPYGAESHGVSRLHLKLRPTETNLYAIDVGSSNGTQKNGQRLGVNVPYNLASGDRLRLGGLLIEVTILRQPTGRPISNGEQLDLATSLILLGKAMSSQMGLPETLSLVLQYSMAFTDAGEMTIWLVDEQTGELFLEAERGIEDEQIKRMRLPISEDSLIGEIIKEGKPVRASRSIKGEQIKIKTGYVVEAILYVPMTIGGITIGVLAAVHREAGKDFTSQHEQILATIADFAAIAVQNARAYEVIDRALTRRMREVEALNALMGEVATTLDTEQILCSLLKQLQKRWQPEDIGLWLVDEATREAVPFSGACVEAGDLTSKTFSRGEGPVGKVVQTGERFVSIGAQSAAKIGDDDLEATFKFSTKSIACVPLKEEGEVIAVLGIFTETKHGFSEGDLDLLETFAHPVASALYNAHLFARSESERAKVHAAAKVLMHPFMIIDEQGELILSNEAADKLLDGLPSHQTSESADMNQVSPLGTLLQELGQSDGRAMEVEFGDKVYVATVEHAPGVATLIMMQDVTQTRSLERLRNEFAEMVSHDLRGPLGSIKGYAEMMREFDPPVSKRREFLDAIIESTGRTIDLASQLLDFALLSGPSKQQIVEVSIQKLVSEAINDLRGMALAKSIELEFDISGRPYTIRADARRIYRSLLNLVENALKYSPENSRVTVSLAFQQDSVVVRVRDSGPGIAEEELPYIFEKLYRAKDVPNKQPGVGLGLTMVKSTIEAHGGKVVAHNITGGGTEFIVTLPAQG